MSHADTIRRTLEMYEGYWPSADQKRINAEARGALDELLVENRLLKENLRIREESQIPVIPRGAQEKMERLEAESQQLREVLAALTALADGFRGRGIYAEGEAVIDAARAALAASDDPLSLSKYQGAEEGEPHG